MIVRAARPDEFDWIVERTGLELSSGTRIIEATDDSGRILAQIAAEGWTPNAVRIHIAVDSPIALRRLAREAAVWIFEQVGRGVVIGIVKSDNARILDLARHAGFREAYRVVDGWEKGVDLVALEMRKEWCRWLSPARKVAA